MKCRTYAGIETSFSQQSILMNILCSLSLGQTDINTTLSPVGGGWGGDPSQLHNEDCITPIIKFNHLHPPSLPLLASSPLDCMIEAEGAWRIKPSSASAAPQRTLRPLPKSGATPADIYDAVCSFLSFLTSVCSRCIQTCPPPPHPFKIHNAEDKSVESSWLCY